MEETVKILEFMESLHLIRLNRPMGDWYSIYCPKHADGNERRASCGVSLVDQVRNGQSYPKQFVHCFTCSLSTSLKDLAEDLLNSHNVSTKDADRLKEMLNADFDVSFDHLLPQDTVKNLNNQFALDYVRAKSNLTPQYVTESELAEYRYTVPYMYERKLTDEVIEKFDVGVDLHFVPTDRVREVPCITFPVKDINGNVLFVYRRAIANKNFYMPAGLEKPVYGIYELAKTASVVVLCESIFNCLTCYVYGVPALALFGTGTKAQIEMLKRTGVKEYVLGLDPDDAGLRGSNKLKRALSSVAIVRKMEIPKGKDINDLTKEEFDESFNERA